MLTVTTGHRSDVGRVRHHNEDSVLVGERIWAVADGMGGHAAGDVASALVIEGLRPLDGRPDLRPADLVAALHAVNDRILTHGHDNPAVRGLGSTVTGLAVVNVGGADHWAVFNVGDSRVYREADGVLNRATVDHSEAEELILEGVITPEQARTHRARNIVTRSLGQPDTPQVDLWLLPQLPGERFLVCSDGLNGELEDGAIHEILTASADPAAAASSLVEAAIRGGGRDNITAIVVNVDGDDDEPGQTNPRPREVPA
ncbi:MAG TPA: serine/threonine-protein phosphatase [Propionibacterium sp.]|nr:serine/threonine-protein phosphatase [Propionibacterium sp.]